jgi:hypothetical protein
MAYSEKVVEHYENPRNVGSFDKSDESVGTGMVGAPACGDVMKLQIKVNPQTGVGQGQDPGPGGRAEEQPDRRGTGAAAGEDPLLDPGRRRDQGRSRGLQEKTYPLKMAPTLTVFAAPRGGPGSPRGGLSGA